MRPLGALRVLLRFRAVTHGRRRSRNRAIHTVAQHALLVLASPCRKWSVWRQDDKGVIAMEQTEAAVMLPRLLTSSQVCDLLGTSRMTLHRWCRAGEFPAAIRTGVHSVRWLATEVAAWIADRDRVTGNVGAV